SPCPRLPPSPRPSPPPAPSIPNRTPPPCSPRCCGTRARRRRRSRSPSPSPGASAPDGRGGGHDGEPRQAYGSARARDRRAQGQSRRLADRRRQGAGVSRGPVVNAREDLATEARRKPRETMPSTSIGGAKTDRRARAQQFLKDELARGPKRVTDIEEAAAKAHLDVHVLEQARADLGIVTSRANTGGVHAVQWSLPG